jgi:hypothetical protein
MGPIVLFMLRRDRTAIRKMLRLHHANGKIRRAAGESDRSKGSLRFAELGDELAGSPFLWNLQTQADIPTATSQCKRELRSL